MGQKVNPIIFKAGNSGLPVASWHTESESYYQLLLQDLELRSFLLNILKNRGILVRHCRIERSFNKLFIDLDLYFSYIISKQSKFVWARSLFRVVREKYPIINRIRDVKSFVFSVTSVSLIDKESKKKYVPLCGRNFYRLNPKFSKNMTVGNKQRLFFFLNQKKKSRINKVKDFTRILGVVKKWKKTSYGSSSSLVRLNSKKFNRLFVLKKFCFNFKSYFLRKYFFSSHNSFDLVELNQNLCKSIQKFCGIEEVQLNLFSNQFNYLASFKFLQYKLIKELNIFQRNRDLNKYFLETLEVLYFVTRTFGFGNAYLLASIVVLLLENIKKQIIVTRFLKKSLNLLFRVLPYNDIAVDGIKILVKGRFNKRRRTKKVLLQEGQISLQTISASIDYYQTQAVTIYGTFGIKIWILKRRLF